MMNHLILAWKHGRSSFCSVFDNIIYSLEQFYLRPLRLYPTYEYKPLWTVILLASKIPSNQDTLDEQPMIYFCSLDELLLS